MLKPAIKNYNLVHLAIKALIVNDIIIFEMKKYY